MAKPPTSVRSIRLPDTVWAALTARAAQTGMSVNALMAAGAEFATTILVHRSDVAASGLAKPQDIVDVTVAAFGPQRAKFGERLKKR